MGRLCGVYRDRSKALHPKGLIGSADRARRHATKEESKQDLSGIPQLPLEVSLQPWSFSN